MQINVIVIYFSLRKSYKKSSCNYIQVILIITEFVRKSTEESEVTIYRQGCNKFYNLLLPSVKIMSL
jgi:hypothetical protein